MLYFLWMNIKYVLVTVISIFLFFVLNPSAIFATSPPCPKIYTDYTILLPSRLPEGVALVYDNAKNIYKLVNASAKEIYLGKLYPTEQEKLDWMERWNLEEVPHPSDLPKNLMVTTIIKNGQLLEMNKGQLIPKPYDMGLDRSAINFYGGKVDDSVNCGNPDFPPGIKLDNFSITIYGDNQAFVISGYVLALPNSPLSYLKYLVFAVVVAFVTIIALLLAKKSGKKLGGGRFWKR